MSGISKRVSGSWVSGDYGIMKTATDTITTLPADIYANDTTATVGLKGNMEQSGTPTPQNPIQPSECGERTGNLFDKSIAQATNFYGTSQNVVAQSNGVHSFVIDCVPNATYTITKIDSNRLYVYQTAQLPTNGIGVLQTDSSDITTQLTFATTANTNYLIIFVAYEPSSSDPTDAEIANSIMLNTGSTPLPYEPYGYKIPISSASTTTPVYLGEVESTRRIRKKVLDGTETTWSSTIVQGRMNFNWKTGSQNPTGTYVLCTHYKSEYAVREGVCFITSNNVSFIDSRFQSLDDFKNFLADEYVAGHPVTVWYVIANPTTGIVNEPIRKIGDYADTVSGITIPTIAGADSFDVLTTLKPSEVTANYHGWHTGAVHERDSGQWN